VATVQHLETEKRRALALAAKYRAKAIAAGATLQVAKSKAFDKLSKDAYARAQQFDAQIAHAIAMRGEKRLSRLRGVDPALGAPENDPGHPWVKLALAAFAGFLLGKSS